MSKSEFLQSDRRLDADITKAGTFEDLRALLENAVERSPLGVTRDPQTGQYIRRDPLAAAAQTVEPEETEMVTKAVTIGGKEFSFTGDALDVERQIGAALQVAEALKTAPIPGRPVCAFLPMAVYHNKGGRRCDPSPRSSLPSCSPRACS